MTTRRRPQNRGQKKKQKQPEPSSNQAVIGAAIGVGATLAIVGVIFLVTQLGGGSNDDSQTVVVNDPAVNNTPADNGGNSQPVTPPTTAPTNVTPESEGPPPGEEGPPSEAEGPPSTEPEMEMAPDGADPTAGPPVTPKKGGGGSGAPEMTEPEMAGPPDGSDNPEGPGGGTGTSSSGKGSAEFLEEISNIEVPDEEMKLPDLIERVEPSVVRINARSSAGYSIGSGYVISSSGLVATNYHVIEGIKSATVEFSDGQKGEVIGFRYVDPKYDIAIIEIKVEGRELVPLPLADELPKKGESVVAFGAPHGLSFTTTEGIISAIRTSDDMQSQLGADMKGSWLQTSTPISPGNSGGPLVNLRGQVVAMNTMQMTSGQNLNFAVSSIDVLDLAKQGSGKKLAKLDPKVLKPASKDLKRKLAKDIQGTDRGNKLLSQVDEIFLILLYQTKSIDPSGVMKHNIYSHAELAIEKSGVNLSFGEPSGDAAIMLVTVKTKFVKKSGTRYANGNGGCLFNSGGPRTKIVKQTCKSLVS